MLAGNEFQSLGRAIVKEDEYEEVRWDGIRDNWTVLLRRDYLGASYLQMLETMIPRLNDLFDNEDGYYFQQDGAPAHFHVNVRNFLKRIFNHRWIGRRENATELPLRSRDLTPPDFYLWGALKEAVYATKLQRLETRESRSNVIPLATIQLVCRSDLRRCWDYIVAEGCHFEHNMGGVTLEGKIMQYIRSADDMALSAEEMILRDMLLELNDSCEQYGMKINVNKTKTMVVGRKIKKMEEEKSGGRKIQSYKSKISNPLSNMVVVL
ncbi:hypothetical protein ANN_21413 [Periplaneta americana]|uniref:Reverse transcriptase n=1 Tax=Periplaneta americana TaxID=6978 RepID=A0ABQ8SF77_PERAM|nr:hypothetical protein ANN_21413 [Periplaneta americana]